jgi:hypothetical protein
MVAPVISCLSNPGTNTCAASSTPQYVSPSSLSTTWAAKVGPSSSAAGDPAPRRMKEISPVLARRDRVATRHLDKGTPTTTYGG